MLALAAALTASSATAACHARQCRVPLPRLWCSRARPAAAATLNSSNAGNMNRTWSAMYHEHSWDSKAARCLARSAWAVSIQENVAGEANASDTLVSKHCLAKRTDCTAAP